MHCSVNNAIPARAASDLPWFADLIRKSVGGDFDDYTKFVLDEPRRLKMLEIINMSVASLKDRCAEDDDLATELVRYAFSLAQWASHGLNVFDITASLTAALLLTTPTSEHGFPDLPFPSFHIRIPSGFLPLIVKNGEESSTRWADRITVNQFWTSAEGESSRLVTRIECGEVAGRVPDLCYVIENERFTSPSDMCREIVNDFECPRVEEDCYLGTEDAVTEQLCFLLVANFCAWLDTIGGTKNRKPDNAVRNNDRSDKARIAQWIVGREVKLEPELIRSAKDHVLGLDPRRRPASWALSRQHTIRGHHRMQACGPQMSERKRIWIAPHWHGPKGGDVAAHIYKLQSTDDRKKK